MQKMRNLNLMHNVTFNHQIKHTNKYLIPFIEHSGGEMMIWACCVAQAPNYHQLTVCLHILGSTLRLSGYQTINIFLCGVFILTYQWKLCRLIRSQNSSH